MESRRLPKHSPRAFITPDWRGEEAFIIGGGTSVDVEAVASLRHRPGAHVIVVNSSYLYFPWAEMLFFADERWVREEVKSRPEQFRSFAGEKVTILGHAKYDGEGLTRIHRETHPGLATARDKVNMHYSSATAAINIAVHKGARRIVLVGIDNRDGDERRPDGSPRVHFHEGYKWPRNSLTWQVKHAEFQSIVAPLRAAGVEVINASPISTLPWWPRPALADWLKENPA